MQGRFSQCRGNDGPMGEPVPGAAKPIFLGTDGGESELASRPSNEGRCSLLLPLRINHIPLRSFFLLWNLSPLMYDIRLEDW